MHAGIDIGTTHISALLMDREGKMLISSSSYANRRIRSTHPLMYEQDPNEIERIVREIISDFPEKPESIVITGQVHGITYYDSQNSAISPHATWLDKRSEIEIDGKSIGEHFLHRTGRALPAGYGFITHYANTLLDTIPEEAVGFTGILEYITGRLIGTPLTLSDPSCLGTMGGFDPVTKRFDERMISEVLRNGISTPLESCASFSIAGYTDEGVPVLFPVGDNQAGFFGLVKEGAGSTLLSIGTSGQISYLSDSTEVSEGMELRNLLDAGYIHVGATLTSGKAYENLKSFFESVYEGLTGEGISGEEVFTRMKRAADEDASPEAMSCSPLFAGTRRDGSLKGSYSQITLNNFTMGQMVRSTVDGIVQELKDFAGETPLFELVATGSAVRKNHLFRASIERIFQKELYVSQIDDGAAFGAALIGAIGTGAVQREEKDRIIDLFRSE